MDAPRQCLGRVELTAGQRRRARVLAAQLDPPVPLARLLTRLHALGIQAGFEPGGLLLQVREPHLGRGPRENLIGERGLIVGQVRGGVADDAGPVAVDQPGLHPGAGARQPAGDVAGHVDEDGRAVSGGVHLEAELLGRVLAIA
jgi:hypothetical protein